MSVNPIPTLPPGFVDIFNHEGEDPDPGGHFDHLSKKRTWYLLMGASAGVVFFSFLIMWLWIRLETFGRWMVTAAPHDGGPNHQRQYLKTWCGWLDVSSGRGKRKMARLQEGKARQERSRDDQELIYRNPNVVDLGDALQAMDIDRTIRPAWLGGSPKKSKEAKRHGPARSPKPRFDNKTSQSPGKHTTAPEKPRHPPPGEPPARSTSIEVPTNDVSNSSSHGRSKRFPVLHKQPAPRIVVSKFTIDNGTLRKRDVVRDRACMHGSDGSGDIVRATTTQFLRPPSTPNGSRARKITATMSLTLPRRHVPVADQRPFDNRSVSLPTRRMNPSIDSVGSQRTKGKKQRRMFRSNVTDTPSEDSDVVPSKRLLAGETDDTGGTVTPGGSTPPPGVLALHDKMRPLKIRARRASHACGDRSAEETTQPPSFVIPNSNLSPSHTPDSVIRIKSHELEDLETSNVQSSKPPSVLGMSSMISFVTGVSGRGKDVWNGASNILQEVGDSERANGAQLFKTQGTVSKGWHSLKPHKTFGSRSPNTPSCRSISSPAPAEAFWTNDTIRLKSFPHRFPLNVASLLGHHHDSSAKLNRSRRGSSTSTVRPKLMDGDPVSHSHFGIGLSRLGIRTGRHSPFSWTDRNSVRSRDVSQAHTPDRVDYSVFRSENSSMSTIVAAPGAAQRLPPRPDPVSPISPSQRHRHVDHEDLTRRLSYIKQSLEGPPEALHNPNLYVQRRRRNPHHALVEPRDRPSDALNFSGPLVNRHASAGPVSGGERRFSAGAQKPPSLATVEERMMERSDSGSGGGTVKYRPHSLNWQDVQSTAITSTEASLQSSEESHQMYAMSGGLPDLDQPYANQGSQVFVIGHDAHSGPEDW